MPPIGAIPPILITNPNGETVLGYHYSDDGELDTVTYLDNSQRTFVYNSTDNTLQQETLPSGETIDYTYDSESGLETKRTYSRDGEFLYEVISNWDKETGQLKTVTDPTGTTTYHYDSETGALSGLDYANNSSIRYQRDILGRVEKVIVKPNKDGSAEYITEYEYEKMPPSPDYIFKKYSPVERDGKPKGWLIGDLKLSLGALQSKVVNPKNPNQWNAIHKYANWTPRLIAILVVFKG